MESHDKPDVLGLAALHEKIAQAAAPTIIELPGADDKIVINNGTLTHLPTRDPNNHHSHLTIGNAESLARWLLSHGKSDVNGHLTKTTHVTIGGNGVKAEIFTGEARHPIAALPWYEADYEAATQPMSIDRFIDFIDGKGFVAYDGKPDDNRFDAVIATLEALEFDGDKTKVTLKDAGAYTAVTVQAESATVKSPTLQIPRFLHINIRRGAFDLEVLHRFKLRIDPKAFTFRLVDLDVLRQRELTCAKLAGAVKTAVHSLGADPADVVTFIQASPLNTPDPTPAYPGPAAVR
jgi:hypothetical protein